MAVSFPSKVAAPPMPRHAPRRTGPLSIHDCGAFASLARRAASLDALDRALRATLAAPLREQVRLANLRSGRLLFLASTPAWATRLRLQQNALLAAARDLGAEARSLLVRVSPLPQPIVEPERRRHLSPTAAAHLRASAAASTDPEWRELYDRLAAAADALPDD